MTQNEDPPQGGPDEVPTDEQLDVEGPNESTQPSGATPSGSPEPGSEDEQAEDQD